MYTLQSQGSAANILIILGEKEKTNTNPNQLASLCNVRD